MTTRLHLKDRRDGRVYTFDAGPVRIGRAASCELTVSGPGADVVSGTHARLVAHDDRWDLEDLGARNGTFVNELPIPPNESVSLASGQTIGLGERGPRFEVTIEDEVAVTVVEMRAAAPDEATVPLPRAGGAGRAPPLVEVTLLHEASRQRLEASGGRLRVGRGRECELRVPQTEQAVSRVHCEIVLRPGGAPVVRDAQSRNGTLHNGKPVAADQPIAEGDRIQLGAKGPHLTVERLRVPSVAASVPAAPAPSAAPASRPRRSFGGKGRTVFVRELISATDRKHASRVRAVVWTFVVLLTGAVGGVYWFLDRRARATEAEVATQRQALQSARAVADSVQAAAAAEYRRLATALDSARAGSAPAAVVDSLRVALNVASSRTASLEQALTRAREGLGRQLSAAESLRQATQQETARLRAELAASRTTGIDAAALDSLRSAVQAAEQRATTLEAGVRAVRGVDLARIAQANQGAVGLVSAFAGREIFDGSGFAITASGYFVTNRHVVEPGGRPADSVHVTMADQRTGYRAVVVAVEPGTGPDLALLLLPKYAGPHVTRGDWEGTRARQGEPAALIGFPAGVAAALDNSRTVRTSMSAGIFSKVTPDGIQFDGFTVGGSSGSPIFNANGDVVAVHRAGLAHAPGLGFAVPVSFALRLLPEDARRELTR